MSQYPVIYADPPWLFATRSQKGKGRSAEAHYECMSMEQLHALPVADLAAPDSVLFMWVTDPTLPDGLDLMNSWGFDYKTVGFYWTKLNKKSNTYFMGLGYWTRSNPEICLLGTRGRPRRRANDVRKLIISRRREHSRKPDEARQRIEQLLEGPYLELFARSSRPGWDTIGDQAGLFDGGHVPTRRWPSNLVEKRDGT